MTEDIVKLSSQGINVDDQNKPTPENMWQPPLAQQPMVIGLSLLFVHNILMQKFPTTKKNGNYSHGIILQSCQRIVESFKWMFPLTLCRYYFFVIEKNANFHQIGVTLNLEEIRQPNMLKWLNELPMALQSHMS